MLLNSLISEYSGVIFDMDGTLVDSEYLYLKAWGECLNRQGLYFDEWEDFFNKHCAGRTFYDGERALIDKFGPQIDLKKLNDEASVIWGQLASDEGLQLKPGSLKLIETLKEADISMAVATSAGREEMKKTLEPLGLVKYFSAIITGDDIPNGRGKPHPDIFLKAAGSIGISPISCIIFEDSAAGVLGAHATGAFVVHIPDRAEIPNEIKAKANLILRSMDELF